MIPRISYVNPRAVCAIFIAALSASTTSFAMDCSHASTFVEKAICGNEELQAEDAALNAAYFNLLKTINDADIHDILVASQRRWLKAQNAQFQRNDDDQVVTILADEIRQRTKELTATNHAAPIVERAQNIKRFISLYTGGPYAGATTKCFFAPPGFGNGSYTCYGTMSLQNNDRVCLYTLDLAGIHATNYWAQGAVINGRPKLVASCAEGYAAGTEPCSGSGSDPMRKWSHNAPDDEHLEQYTFIRYRDTHGKHFSPDSFSAPYDERLLNACLTIQSQSDRH